MTKHPRVDTLIDRVRTRNTLPPPAERVRIRKAAGVSQRELAAALGVSWTAVQRWETGATPRSSSAEYAYALRRMQELG